MCRWVLQIAITLQLYYNIMYTVSQKKQDTKLLATTSPIIIRFSKIFH